MQVICHPKGTFAIQGVMSTLKDKQHQAAFVSLILNDVNRLVKNKDGSYIVKEIYRHFDASFLDQITQIFKSDFEKNISDKYSICIFKEIAIRAGSEKPKLDALFQEFAQYFHEFKINTFYHFGIQYFVEVRRSHPDLPPERLPVPGARLALDRVHEEPEECLEKQVDLGDHLALTVAPADPGTPR